MGFAHSHAVYQGLKGRTAQKCGGKYYRNPIFLMVRSSYDVPFNLLYKIWQVQDKKTVIMTKDHECGATVVASLIPGREIYSILRTAGTHCNMLC